MKGPNSLIWDKSLMRVAETLYEVVAQYAVAYHPIYYKHRKAVLLESMPSEISIPIQSHPILPLIDFEHLSLSMVI